MTKSHNDKELEQLKDAKFIEKYYWLFDKREKYISILQWFFLQKPKFSKPTIDYENMSQKEKLKRVLVALEKVHHANPQNFDKKEIRALQPTRAGSLNKLFQLGLTLGNASWIFYTLASRNFRSKNLMLLTSFTVLNQLVFLDSINIIKERLRYKKGLKLAQKYLDKYENNMQPFIDILNPLADHHDISHIQINYSN